MSEYRRFRVPGGTYFFTINLLRRRGNTLLVDCIDVLRTAMHDVRAQRPFHIDGWVVLPEHMHLIITLPPGDDDFPNRIKSLKIRFGKRIPISEHRSAVRVAKGERGIWQRRFWEHAIRDAVDYERHMDYLHFNPVKHGHATRVADWPYSTFHRYVEKGLYTADWGGTGVEDFPAGE
jgi:putative transposase